MENTKNEYRSQDVQSKWSKVYRKHSFVDLALKFILHSIAFVFLFLSTRT